MGADCGWGRVEVPTWPDGKPFKLEATPLPDLTKDRVTDASPGVPVRLNPIYIRNHVQYFLYADSARKINLKALVQPVGGSKFEYCKFRLYTLDGKLIGMVSLKQEFRKEQPISFDVPERGFYKLFGMVVKSHAMTLVESDVPVALVASSFYGLPGWSTLPGGGYIAVPEGSRRFAVLAQGGSGDEVMSEIADRMEEDALQAMDNTVSRIEPTMVLAAGVLVGGILFSVMVPLLHIMTAIG